MALYKFRIIIIIIIKIVFPVLSITDGLCCVFQFRNIFGQQQTWEHHAFSSRALRSSWAFVSRLLTVVSAESSAGCDTDGCGSDVPMSSWFSSSSRSKSSSYAHIYRTPQISLVACICSQWLKCNRTQGNAVPLPTENGLKRSPHLR